MSLLGRIQQAYGGLFPPKSSATDPRMKAYDEYLVLSRMGGRYSLLEFVEDEQVSAQLRYARKHPLKVPRQGLVSRIASYFSK